MTARISGNGELRVHGREVEIIIKHRWTDADLQAAAALDGAPIRFTIEAQTGAGPDFRAVCEHALSLLASGAEHQAHAVLDRAVQLARKAGS